MVVDLCYERLIYDGVPHNLPNIFGDVMRDRLVLAGSTSKAYAMTGWRCGWMAAPKAGRLGGQRAAEPLDVQRELDHAEAPPSPRSPDRRNAWTTCSTSTRRRRDQVLAWLAEEPRLRCARAARRVLRVSRHLAISCRRIGMRTSLDFADGLLRDEHVVTTAGEAFDAPGYLRLSYATSLDGCSEGVTRLIAFARTLAPAR